MKYLPLLLVLLVACSGPVVDDATTEDATGDTSALADAPKDADKGTSVAKKVKDFFGEGMALKCAYNMDSPEGSGEYTTWMSGKNVRSEGVFDGISTLVIMRDEVVYSKNEEASIDCDWIKYAIEETEHEVMDIDDDFTLEEVEATYKDEFGSVDCAFAKAPSGAFDTPGKVCDFEEMMAAQMAAAGIDLSDYQ